MTQAPSTRIFHIATRADWQAAVRSGSYTTSTLGRDLAEVGFVHACRREQVKDVFGRYYREAGEPLVLLTIASEHLEAEVREEQVGDEAFPHIYGPINRGSVIDVRPLGSRGGVESMATLFAKEMASRMALALVVMVATVIGSVVADSVSGSESAPLVGALIGLVAGAGIVGLLVRSRRD